MVREIRGDRTHVTFVIAHGARMVQGIGQVVMDDEAAFPVQDFVRVSAGAKYRCFWRFHPGGRAEVFAQFSVTKRDDGDPTLHLDITWPDHEYLRAEQLMDALVASEGGSYAIHFPSPTLRQLGDGDDSLPHVAEFAGGTPLVVNATGGELALRVTHG